MSINYHVFVSFKSFNFHFCLSIALFIYSITPIGLNQLQIIRKWTIYHTVFVKKQQIEGWENEAEKTKNNLFTYFS